MLDELVPLTPVHFFAISHPCYSVKRRKLEKIHLLPSLFELNRKRAKSEVSIGWHKEGIAIKVEGNVQEMELFFDTRDQKKTSYPTRFCHHFYFNLEEEEGSEVTRFRTDDAHELCNPELLQITAEGCWIPKECLFGYEPSQFNRLGFTYRLNGGEQIFSISDEDFSIEKHPAFWASLILEEKK
ncbi:MAG: hypothetical protein S4CHLAM45_04830 [Chlamydiales bacterium]|nr:hypothetical protein [Chlamydiales bacterium]MCH9619976.1 hypothetical protein [Chlamydiales bacterium]MCH9622597.1 hypothetical protein [Chlamydiales bacterium]